MPSIVRAVTIYLVRHGQPDWKAMNARALPGAANDLVPLTDVGARQAEQAAVSLKDTDATRILSSPMTRALQTAAVISRSLDLPVSVGCRRHLPVDRSAAPVGD